MEENTKIYYFEREPLQFEKVTEELWQWEAIYKDLTTIKQFDPTQKILDKAPNAYRFHQLQEIDQAKLHIFKMFSPLSKQEYLIHFDPETMQLFHKYTTTILNEGTPDRKVFKTYHFGYMQDGKLHALSIMPDGTVIMNTNPDKISIL